MKENLAEKIFANIIMNSNNENLQNAKKEIENIQIHQKFKMDNVPFVKNLFQIVLSECEYRKDNKESNLVFGKF